VNVGQRRKINKSTKNQQKNKKKTKKTIGFSRKSEMKVGLFLSFFVFSPL